MDMIQWLNYAFSKNNDGEKKLNKNNLEEMTTEDGNNEIKFSCQVTQHISKRELNNNGFLLLPYWAINI